MPAASELEARRGELAALEQGIAETVRDRAARVRDDVRGTMSGLRAELAAAAQEARAAAPAAHRPEPRPAVDLARAVHRGRRPGAPLPRRGARRAAPGRHRRPARGPHRRDAAHGARLGPVGGAPDGALRPGGRAPCSPSGWQWTWAVARRTAVTRHTAAGGHTVAVTSPASDQSLDAPRPRFPVVLFDLDGTLADTIPLIVASYQHAFRTVLAEEVEEAPARAWIGRPLLPALLEESPEHGHELDRVYREWNLANTARLIQRYPGVPELLADLTAAGVTCAVATSKRRETARLALRWASASTTSSTSSRPWRTPPPTSRLPTRCCTPPRPWRRPGRLRLRRRRHRRRARRPGRRDGRRRRHLGRGGARGAGGHRPGRPRRHGSRPRGVPPGPRATARVAAVHGKRYEENKHTELAALADAVMAYAEERVRISPPLDQPMSQDELDRLVGQTITAEGFGGIATMRMFAEDLAPTCLSTDHPRYLAPVPVDLGDGDRDEVVGRVPVLAHQVCRTTPSLHAPCHEIVELLSVHPVGRPPESVSLLIRVRRGGSLGRLHERAVGSSVIAERGWLGGTC